MNEIAEYAGKRIVPVLLALIVLAAACVSACSPEDGAGKAESAGAAQAAVPAPAEADAARGAADITGLRFVYDKYSGEQYYLNAFVEDLSASGGKVILIKRVGPMNYTGHKKEGELALDGAQAARLREILSGYDLEAWSKLPTASSGVSPTRSLIVFSGDEILYKVMWNAKFPKTLPPQEDILYYELYSFFNGLISAEPGWEEVRSGDPEDPRDNPAYYERTVTWFGHRVKLVPGTGTYHEDGRYAEIDYEGRDWWIEEGFTGSWTLDGEAPSIDPCYARESASLTVNGDGSLVLVLDGEVWQGKVSGLRRYRDSFGITLQNEDFGIRRCEVSTPVDESYDRIHISYQSDPYPADQYEPIDVFLVRSGN